MNESSRCIRIELNQIELRSNEIDSNVIRLPITPLHNERHVTFMSFPKHSNTHSHTHTHTHTHTRMTLTPVSDWVVHVWRTGHVIHHTWWVELLHIWFHRKAIHHPCCLPLPHPPPFFRLCLRPFKLRLTQQLTISECSTQFWFALIIYSVLNWLLESNSSVEIIIFSLLCSVIFVMFILCGVLSFIMMFQMS